MPPTAQTVIQRITDTLYAPFRYSGAGIPEGVQVSEPGWIYRDTNNGILWFKKTGSAATGWKARPGTLVMDTTQTGNVGSGEDTLQTYTLPAGMLKDDGDAIRITVGGKSALNGNSKTLNIRFGGIAGTIVLQLNVTTSGTHWTGTALIVRTAAATQKAIAPALTGGGTVNVVYATPAQDLTSAVTILVTGSATADDDILKQIFTVELLPAP
jgi:hypothetical protein